MLNNQQCQQQNPSHHSLTLLQFNVFLCLHIWQDVHAALQQSPQNYRHLGSITYRPTYWIASSRFSTLQLGRSPIYVAQITSLTLLPVFTGFVLLRALISNWRSLYTELCTTLHLDTCLTFFTALLTCRLVIVYGRRPPTNLMSARRVS